MAIVFIQVWLGWGRSSPTGKEPGLPREREGGRDDNRTREEGRFLPSLRLRDAEGCCSCSTAPPRGGEQSGEVKWRGNASSKLGLLLRKSRTNVRQCVRACPSVCLHVPVREVRRRMYVARPSASTHHVTGVTFRFICVLYMCTCRNTGFHVNT